MALVDLWKNSPAQLKEKHVQQLISFAGSGHLGDNNSASSEFRDFLRNIPIDNIRRYSEECLVDNFDGSGFALQDLVNEVGTRLGFDVLPGRYRGAQGHIGFDGLWESPEGRRIVIEVKTTDAYRIDLNTIAGYRRSLIKDKGWSEEDVSILIVVGRQDTGDLEAQIRGSKHAWDIRLISVDSLLRLLDIKVELEDPQSEVQVREILVPHEYTRVDSIINLVFSTAEEVKQDTKPDADLVEPVGKPSTSEPKFVAVNFHEAVASVVSSHLGTPLVRRSRAFYTDPAKTVGVLCSVSKRHSGSVSYWYGFHPYQQDRLTASEHGYVAFGCGSAQKVLLIPFPKFEPLLGDMNQTHLDDGRYYWHVHIADEDGRLILRRKGGLPSVDMTAYLVRAQA